MDIVSGGEKNKPELGQTSGTPVQPNYPIRYKFGHWWTMTDPNTSQPDVCGISNCLVCKHLQTND